MLRKNKIEMVGGGLGVPEGREGGHMHGVGLRTNYIGGRGQGGGGIKRGERGGGRGYK